MTSSLPGSPWRTRSEPSWARLGVPSSLPVSGSNETPSGKRESRMTQGSPELMLDEVAIAPSTGRPTQSASRTMLVGHCRAPELGTQTPPSHR